MKAKFLGMTALGLMAAIVLTAASQPPGKDGGDKKGKRGDAPEAKGAPDGKGPPRWELGRLLPPFVVDQLDLTESQQKELAELQKEVKTKVLKILTKDQRQKLENMRFPAAKGGPGGRDGPPGGGPGGPGGKGGGGFGPGGPGGPGGKGGPPPKGPPPGE